MGHGCQQAVTGGDDSETARSARRTWRPREDDFLERNWILRSLTFAIIGFQCYSLDLSWRVSTSRDDTRGFPCYAAVSQIILSSGTLWRCYHCSVWKETFLFSFNVFCAPKTCSVAPKKKLVHLIFWASFRILVTLCQRFLVPDRRFALNINFDHSWLVLSVQNQSRSSKRDA